MLNRLERPAGGKPWQNRVGLEESARALLAEDLEALVELDPDLPTSAMRYVLDGEGEEVLAQLASTLGAAAALRLVGARSGVAAIARHAGREDSVRARFFKSVRCARPELFVRLGKIYEAALRLEQANLAAQVARSPRLAAIMPGPSFGNPNLGWLDLLLVEAAQLRLDTWPRRCQPCQALDAELVEAMLQSEGHSPDLLVREAFKPASQHSGSSWLQPLGGPWLAPVFLVMEGIARSAVRHQGAVLDALNDPDFKQRLYALEMMKSCRVPVAPFAETLVALATGPSKQVREHAAGLLAGIKETATPWLELRITSGTNAERALAVPLLWQWNGEAARAFLEQRLAGEKSRSVLQAIQDALAASPQAPAPVVPDDALALPELAPVPPAAPLGPEAERAWQEFFSLDVLFSVYRRDHPKAGLRELAASLVLAGHDASCIGQSLLGSYWEAARPFGLPPSDVWPYWAEHLELLEEAFAPLTEDFMGRYAQRQRRRNAFLALRTFPKPPARLTPLLWTLALGPKNERSQAQGCLERASDKFERLTAALSGGSAESRLAAAEWLGRTGDQQAITALLGAVKKEKNDVTKGAIMGALEQLGVLVEDFLDRAGLLKEASKGLSRGGPTDLKWFPFQRLPAVHWDDSGAVVEPEIVHWWLVQGCKLKNPEPGALLRWYAAHFRPAEREALGQFILEAWIAEDTAPIPRAEAENRAQTNAQQMRYGAQYFFQQAQKDPKTWGAPKPPLTLEQYYAQALASTLKQPKGSAIDSKGILSVAGACVGGGAVPVVNRYLKDWYGYRPAQCKALLQMLAWVEHRTATQLLLAVGSRFRTKGIQEEANRQAQAVAERKGWTLAELADRTIPSAGLDEQGVLTIDYGPRQFTARLNEELEFALTDGEGKALKALPDPRKDDDEAKAAAARKMFSAAKKELKSVLSLQRERLYEAMCTQRTWPIEDWNLYLNRHPILRHHCQRLAWAAVRDGGAAGLFRPLADGSLTDVADEPVTYPDGTLVRVGHECQVTPEQSRAWRQHFQDYNIEPLFEQFGRPDFKLSEERQTDPEIADFEGHTLEAFRLRGRATKLGYTRGQAQDGGWFYDYHKRFPTLGLEAVIEFTGNGLPEENRTVALKSLRFARVADEGESSPGGDAVLLLSEVPAVLLSECWNDFRTLAAEGPGFDPEWEKKTSP